MADIEYTAAPLCSRVLAGRNRYPRGYRVRRASGTPDYLLLVTLAGAGEVRGKGGVTQLKSGDLVLIPPHCPHAYGVAGEARRWTVRWVHFHPWAHWDELLDWPLSAAGLPFIHLHDSVEREQLEKGLEAVQAAAHSLLPRRELQAMNALERALLHCVSDRPGSARETDARIQLVKQALVADLARRWSVASMAQVAGLSESRFAHLFRECVQASPLRYLEYCRLERARDLLARTTLPVAAVAMDVGFEDAYYFCRRFRRATGFSPSQFRRRHVMPGS